HGGRAALQAEVCPIDGDVGVGPEAVEEDHGLGGEIVTEGFAPDLVGADGAGVVDDLDAFLAGGILVDGDGLGVGEDGERLGGHAGEVIAHDERRGHDAPHGEMRLVLNGGHATAADFEHVGIVPTTRSSGVGGGAVRIDVGNHAGVVVADVAGGAPVIAQDGRPRLVGLGISVLAAAEAEQDGPAGFHQRVAHAAIVHLGVGADGQVAVVLLQVVGAPLGIGVGVDVFIEVTAGLVLAGVGAVIGIDAELKSERVDVIRERGHAVGKFAGIGDNHAIGIAGNLPAVVHIHVLVAGSLQSASIDDVGIVADDRFADAAAVGVPIVPAHRRGQGEIVGESNGGAAQNESCKQDERAEVRPEFSHKVTVLITTYVRGTFGRGYRVRAAGQFV